jgi:hypothetical protein
LPPQNDANGKSARQKPNGGSSGISLDDRPAKFLGEIPEGSEKISAPIRGVTGDASDFGSEIKSAQTPPDRH